ncbi:MAG: hypothetical protein RSD49_08020 [Hafnia sp.]
MSPTLSTLLATLCFWNKKTVDEQEVLPEHYDEDFSLFLTDRLGGFENPYNISEIHHQFADTFYVIAVDPRDEFPLQSGSDSLIKAIDKLLIDNGTFKIKLKADAKQVNALIIVEDLIKLLADANDNIAEANSRAAENRQVKAELRQKTEMSWTEVQNRVAEIKRGKVNEDSTHDR